MTSSLVKEISASEVIDSRGTPTVEATVRLEAGIVCSATVPSGASTSDFEAIELRDGDTKRFHGMGVQNAVSKIEETINAALRGIDVTNQTLIDSILLDMDKTSNKKEVGANTLLSVSIACCKTAAAFKNIPIYQSLALHDKPFMPIPIMNIVNGGAHASNNLDIQEFQIISVKNMPFRERVRMGCEIFHELGKLLQLRGHSTALGDEGGFAPTLSCNQDAIELIDRASEKTTYKLGDDFWLGLDIAADELVFEGGLMRWEGKSIHEEEWIGLLDNICSKFPILSLEDPFPSNNWKAWSNFASSRLDHLQIVSDDLTVTNPKRFLKARDYEAANAIIIKPNQIGTITETIATIQKAKDAGWNCVMSHRSGDTADSFIADLAIATGCNQIKAGSVARGERTAKYNRLMRISDTLDKYGAPVNPFSNFLPQDIPASDEAYD